MSERLALLADGVLAGLDDRLAPEGESLPEHHLRACHDVARAEAAVRALRDEPNPFRASQEELQASDTGFALITAAQTTLRLAVRVRARMERVHARRAAEPLGAGLRQLAQVAEPDDGDVDRALVDAARVLVHTAGVTLAAEAPERLHPEGRRDLAVAQEHLVEHAVLPLLAIAALVQEGALP